MESMQKLFESVEACAERLDQLNKRYAHLATEATQESVKVWKVVKEQILAEQAEELPRQQGPELKSLAIELLEKQGHKLEDAIDILAAEHGITVDLVGLIQGIGKTAYIAALRREAVELQENAISFPQIASLWNDLGRPAIGGETWSARTVSILVE